MKRERDHRIDLLKAIAILLVVFGHSEKSGMARVYIYTFHVPLFFVISGMTFTAKYDFNSFLKKKFVRILLPYYSVGLISIAVYKVLGSYSARALESAKDTGIGIMSLIGNLLFGSGENGGLVFNSPLWFFPCLFCAEILLYLLLHKKRENKKAENWFCIVTALLLLLVVMALDVLGISITFGLPYELDTALLLLPFALFGRVLGNWYDGSTEESKIGLLGGGALLVAAGYLISIRSGNVNYLRDIYGGMIWFYPGALFTCLGFVLLAKRINCPGKAACYLGRHTMIVLLFHKFPILFFQTFVPSVSERLIRGDFLMGVIVTIISVLSCLLFGHMLHVVWNKRGRFA